MQEIDDTQPTRAIHDTAPHMVTMPDEDDAAGTGPGCAVWGAVGVFMVLLAFGTVAMALFAGWNDGYRVAAGNATATTYQDVLTQCDLIPGDLANNSFGLAQLRVNALMTTMPDVPCVVTLAPQMTNAYAAGMSALTPTVTLTPVPAVASPSPEASPTTTSTPAPTSSSGFDLAALLAEAQADLATGENRTAIETLDAIAAVDPTFQKAQVDQMLFSALTSEARDLFLSGQNLAEAIVLTNRAENFGDIGTLNYERFIADLWLQAQAYSGVNYPRAIQILNRIVYEQGLPNYRNASVELFNQYVAYGDALLAGGDPCSARTQYDTALSLSASGSVQGQRAAADAQCSAVIVGGTPGVVATPDPANPGGSGGSGTAPIGERP